MLRHIFYIFIFAILSVVGQARAQILPTIPEEAKQFPDLYPPKQEMLKAHTWAQESVNQQIKIYSKEAFEALDRDDQAQLEGYGYIIIYRGKYLTLEEIDAYELRKRDIISRTYSEYKQYLYENNPQRFKELFD